MAKRNSGRRGRARKRRGGEQRVAPPAAAAKPVERAPRRDAGRLGELHALGERPQAPWHPWPLSELLILVGMIGAVVGFLRREAGQSLLFAGIGAIVLGTLEFTVREHLSGYRPHTTLLSAVPTALFHGACAFALFSLGASPATCVIAPLILDVPLFIFLFKLLRQRFDDARRERVFAGRR